MKEKKNKEIHQKKQNFFGLRRVEKKRVRKESNNHNLHDDISILFRVVARKELLTYSRE